jgi:uncharacterized protein YlxW (UPF0749 family)
MRKKALIYSLFVSVVLTGATQIHAQDLNNPGEYMSAVSNAHLEMNQKYMAYMSAAAHGRRARKVEKLRQQALNSIMDSKTKTISLPYYKGDNSLRQSSINYIQLCYNVFNEDYNKIVNMEEIAEQSIDQMEAYILLQEKTSEKIREASNKMTQAGKDFAAKYNVQIISAKDELGEKMEKASKLNHYINRIFIIFFKCNFQDGQIVNKINAKKINEVEQSRTALLKYAQEGLAGLDTLRTFEGDAQLSNACRQLLQFYKRMAEQDIPKIIEFFDKQDNFEKLKRNMDAKASKSKEDIDAYNAAVKDVNNSINGFNQLNNRINALRDEMNKNWEATEKAFQDAHMPYYK